MIKSLSYLFVISALIWGSYEYVNQIEIAAKNQHILNSIKPQACESYGGNVELVCGSQTLACIVEYSDAGQTCESGDECQGRCVIKDFKGSIGEQTIGVCETNNNPCGCWKIVENNTVIAKICS